MASAGHEFDEKRYWIERHEKLRGDVRSVGNLANSVEKNSAGEVSLRGALQLVLKHVFPAPLTRTVLDLGCGIGRLAPVLVEHGFDYLGVDVSPAAIEQARQRCPAASFEIADMVHYKAKRRFDLVVASYVLVHLVREEDWIGVLANIANSLLIGGYCLVIDEIPAETPLRTAPHVLTRSLATYAMVLPRLGLDFASAWLTHDREALGAEAFRHFHLIESSTA